MYADVPLAFFILATLAAMAMAEHFKESGHAVLADKVGRSRRLDERYEVPSLVSGFPAGSSDRGS